MNRMAVEGRRVAVLSYARKHCRVWGHKSASDSTRSSFAVSHPPSFLFLFGTAKAVGVIFCLSNGSGALLVDAAIPRFCDAE